MEINNESKGVTDIRECVVCGVDISHRRKDATTCGQICRTKKKRTIDANVSIKKCKGCKKIFTTLLPHKSHCSRICWQKYYKKRIKKDRKPKLYLKAKLNALYRFGLIPCSQPPKGGRKVIKLGNESIKMYCTDLGGTISKTPIELYESFSIKEIHKLCKWFSIDAKTYPTKLTALQAILRSETYSIVETCINEIWQEHHAPPLQRPKYIPVDSDREKTPLILTYEDGLIAYPFFECKEKKQLLSIITQYRQMCQNL